MTILHDPRQFRLELEMHLGLLHRMKYISSDQIVRATVMIGWNINQTMS